MALDAAPGRLHPDVYAAAAARDSAEDVRNAALEEAAAHIESKKPVGTIALVVQAFADEVRTLKSTPRPRRQRAARMTC